jgi:O-antigen biosynthesis protein
MDISVVISAWSDERFALLEQCLSAVLTQTSPSEEVIVAVDHNQPLLEKIALRWPGVRVVATENGRGASNSRNTGARHARAAYVAFLDDDACPDHDWLEKLGDALTSDAVVAVGGSLQPSWPTGSRPWWFPAEFDWVVGCSYRGLPTGRAPVRNVIGANMAIRRDVLDAVGGERPGFGRVGLDPVACEETELFIRIRRRFPQSAILYDPAVRARHNVTPERTRWDYFLKRCRAEGRGKALMSRLTGRGVGLSSERHYATRTLPTGVLQNLWRAVVDLDPRSAARAVVIVVGLAATAQGYATEAIRRPPRS